ncbi:MAG: hypothetical protein ACK5ZH_00340 [Alphaproteobacteria bacterium]|jgi:ABC-type bacteriocin/lantibiotic exporter with double-glycine peptidase domain
MQNALSLLSFVVMVMVLIAALWFSAFLFIAVMGAAILFYIGISVWGWLVRKRILNAHPGQNINEQPGVIEVEYSRITTQSDEPERR